MKPFRILILTISLILLLSSCTNESQYTSKVELNLFYSDVYKYKQLNNPDKDSFKTKYHDVFNLIYKGDNSDSLILSIPSTDIYKYFITDVENRYKNYNLIHERIQKLYANTKLFTDKELNYRINIVITPYNQSVLLTDSSIVLGINHYLGASHPLYDYYDNYIRKNKEPERITYDICDLICKNIIPNTKSNTLLDCIIREGILLHLECKLLNAEPYSVLNYSQDEINWIENNIQNAWIKILGQDLLYSFSSSVINDIINPSPHSFTIHPDCPSKIGRVIGYDIIACYLNETNSSLNFKNLEIIAKLDSKSVLLKSKYNGYRK